MAKDLQATETAVDLAGDDAVIAVMPKPTAELVQMARDAIDGKLPDGAIAQAELGDPEITARRIREEIRNAKTFDDAFGVQKLPAWQDIAGEPVIVHGFHLNPSTKSDDKNPNAPKAYAVVQMTRLATGELEVRQCGGANVVEQLVWAWEREAFPFTVKLTAKENERDGVTRTVLRLEKVEA